MTLLLLYQSALAVEIGLGARNNFDDQLLVDAPQVTVRQAKGHFAVEGYAAYGLSQSPNAMSEVFLSNSWGSGGPVELLEQSERLGVGSLVDWDLRSPEPETGLSGRPHLFLGAEFHTWEEANLRFGTDQRAKKTDSRMRLGVGPVLGAGMNLRLDRLNLRLAMLDRTVIGPRPTINPKASHPVAWTHSPSIIVDALWNLGRSE